MRSRRVHSGIAAIVLGGDVGHWSAASINSSSRSRADDDALLRLGDVVPKRISARTQRLRKSAVRSMVLLSMELDVEADQR